MEISLFIFQHKTIKAKDDRNYTIEASVGSLLFPGIYNIMKTRDGSNIWL